MNFEQRQHMSTLPERFIDMKTPSVLDSEVPNYFVSNKIPSNPMMRHGQGFI